MKAPVTICFTYFKSLALANLAAALYSVRQQDMSLVESIVVVDNDTEDSIVDIEAVIEATSFDVPIYLHSYKHSDSNKTHSWSTNIAIREVTTPWVFFTRADYLLAFDALDKFIAKAGLGHGHFITSNGCHLDVDIGECEKTNWRQTGPRFQGNVFDYTLIDTGVWLARKADFDRIGGLDESLTAWGHAQTDFQYRLYASGVAFVKVPEVLFFHPLHSAPRDIELAHQQLTNKGVDLKTMWARHEGVQPYR